jgi:hypothetical protein
MPLIRAHEVDRAAEILVDRIDALSGTELTLVDGCFWYEHVS